MQCFVIRTHSVKKGAKQSEDDLLLWYGSHIRDSSYTLDRENIYRKSVYTTEVLFHNSLADVYIDLLARVNNKRNTSILLLSNS